MTAASATSPTSGVLRRARARGSREELDSGPGLQLAPEPEPRSPEQLACDARDGERGAFDELVRRLEAPLYHFLCLRTGSPPEAEELVQEAFLRAWQKLDRYDTRWRFSTWLFTVAKRLAASRARVRRLSIVPAEALAEVAGGADPSTQVETRDSHANLWRLAGRVLSVEQRSALWLRYAEDLDIAEIAEILGKRRVTVRVLLFRARDLLARHAKEEEDRLERRSSGGRS